MSDKLDKALDKFKVIGHQKYKALTKYDLDKMDEEQAEMFVHVHKMSISEAKIEIKKYEEKNSPTGGNISEKGKKYLQDLRKNPNPKSNIVITKKWLWKHFKGHFYDIEGKPFRTWKVDEKGGSIRDSKGKLVDEQYILDNISPLIYYFLGDLENFKKCKNVTDASIPSLKKGLLVIGDYGNGKSTTFQALERALKTTPHIFKGYTSNEVVTMYEQCKTPAAKEEFNKLMFNGPRYFDDIKSERMASNYGKSELFKDIFETRYVNKVITHITCNYHKDHPGDLDEALEEFGTKYGDRVYDRIFEMFNIIEFKGTSFRK